MTFQQFCDELNATYDERRQLVHFLAAHRSMTTIEVLMPPEPPGPSADEVIDAWRRGGEA